MGAYHTLDLEMNRKFTLQKSEWDSVALERIGKNCLLGVRTYLDTDSGEHPVH